jgi:hypothetical protein
MISDTNDELAAIGVRLLDDAYLAWFSAEVDSEDALRTWRRQKTGSGQITAYRAALDREEAAARDLERLWSLSAPCQAHFTELVYRSARK